VKKGAAHVLLPTSARKQLNELPDDVLTKVRLFYYRDLRRAVDQIFKFLVVTESVSDS
jgi:predicted ATP-dependent Lon-type protease